MKSILKISCFVILAAIHLETIANADQITEIPVALNIKVAANTMTFEYAMGGGCQNHRGDARIDLKLNPNIYNSKYFEAEAKVTLVDIAPAVDPCEAVTYPKGTVDLKAAILSKIAEAQKKLGPDVVIGKNVTVTLPPLTLDLN